MSPIQQITSINIKLLYLLGEIIISSLVVNQILRFTIKNNYSYWIDYFLLVGSLFIPFLFHDTKILFVLILFWGLFAVSLMDIFYRILPDIINFTLLILGLALSLQGQFISMISSVLGILVNYAILWVVAWNYSSVTGHPGIGKGDLKLAAALGAWLGLEEALHLLFWSSLLGCGFYSIMAIRGEYHRMSKIPFGVFLSIAGMGIFIMRFSI